MHALCLTAACTCELRSTARTARWSPCMHSAECWQGSGLLTARMHACTAADLVRVGVVLRAARARGLRERPLLHLLVPAGLPVPPVDAPRLGGGFLAAQQASVRGTFLLLKQVHSGLRGVAAAAGAFHRQEALAGTTVVSA